MVAHDKFPCGAESINFRSTLLYALTQRPQLSFTALEVEPRQQDEPFKQLPAAFLSVSGDKVAFLLPPVLFSCERAMMSRHMLVGYIRCSM
ncbi:hypothetical protein TorRG33x02_232970 [Trema orientale]|uniref:Uncharacterized protein n=1 Tax=Trema orientale TaxID=63057 RepID=A0A2P5E5S6_TREOI|nr:hypothetical protein TorRG33x02_232970 [Trema orientale]